MLLSGGSAGAWPHSPRSRRWAIGYVAGANALAWIVVAPLGRRSSPSGSLAGSAGGPGRDRARRPGGAGCRVRAARGRRVTPWLLGPLRSGRWIGAELVARGLDRPADVRRRVLLETLGGGARQWWAGSWRVGRRPTSPRRPGARGHHRACRPQAAVAAVTLLMAILFVVQSTWPGAGAGVAGGDVLAARARGGASQPVEPPRASSSPRSRSDDGRSRLRRSSATCSAP